MREIFEETGLSVSETDITSMNLRHRHKTFFCAMLPNDDISLSDEHSEYGFFTLEEAMALDNLSKEYKNAISGCLEEATSETNQVNDTVQYTDNAVQYTGNIKIKVGGQGL